MTPIDGRGESESAFIHPACPKGTKYAGGWATSGCGWSLGCYMPKQINDGMRFIAKCACEETSFEMCGNDGKCVGEIHHWINGRCVTKKVGQPKEKHAELSTAK